MKKIVFIPIQCPDSFEVALPKGTEILEVGIMEGKASFLAIVPENTIEVTEKRNFFWVPFGAAILKDDFKYIGKVVVRGAPYALLEITGPIIHTPNGTPKIPFDA